MFGTLIDSLVCAVMVADSVVDLEREVEEFLLTWSSSTPTEEGIVPRDPGTPCSAQGGDSSQQIIDMVEQLPPDDAEVRPEHRMGRRHRRGGALQRDTGRASHPYRVRERSVVRASALRAYGGSYAAELKATWPARYWKVKESMDKLWRRL